VRLADIDDLVRQWLDSAAGQREGAAARRLAGVLKDPDGLAFTVAFIDRVIRLEDARVAGRELRQLARRPPAFLPGYLRLGLRAGALASYVVPGLVLVFVRAAVRGLVGHLLIDARDPSLTRAIARISDAGARLNVNLLGEAVLGEREAARRLAGTRRLLERDDVDYVSIKVSATVPPPSPWAFDEAVATITGRLLPLFTFAAEAAAPKFINLDMEEYRDLDLTIAVFTMLLDRPELRELEAGIALQAYLPDALGAMQRLQGWAAQRRTSGGAPIKVRLVKGANLPMERVDAAMHGWPLATWQTKQETDANYKRMLRWAMTVERLANVRLGVASHNLFDIAYAWLLAGECGARDGVEFEMLLGMAPGQAAAVQETVGSLRLYVPVVHPHEFDVAIAYLVRRLDEGASQDNFLSTVFDLRSDTRLFDRERSRFRASLAVLDEEEPGDVPAPQRVQDRRIDIPAVQVPFANAPDTDPATAGNRAWARAIVQRVDGSTLGVDLVRAHTVTDGAGLDAVLAASVRSDWGSRSGADRAAVLRLIGIEFERRRAELIEVMAAECGKTVEQGDPEVSEAVDFACYYADLAEELDRVDGARHVPVRLTVVAPPWNFPVSITAGSVLAALAAGSAVVLKPAPEAQRTGSVVAQALWDAGVPADAVQLMHLDEAELGRALVADPRVDRLLLTGAFETARLFRSVRPDLPLIAETSGKNAIVVTPSADVDLAVKAIVASAFGHAGQKCSAASLAILVGSVATSRRFRDQLVDAVTSLRVGWPGDPTTQMGPIIARPAGKLRQALTELAPGEEWLVEPRRLDTSGRLWSPGVKQGVARESAFHLTEYFGPVLGLMRARDLDEAIAIQNEVDFGLTAGLHSLDRDEVRAWIDRVQAGNLYVNRGITGAVVRRQPFGGWKKSSVGAGSKAGPNFLVGLSDWLPAPASSTAPASSRLRGFVDALAPALSPAGRAFFTRAVGSDAAAWQAEFSVNRDVSGLGVELNVLRYLPVPVWIRSDGASVVDLIRVVAAGLRAGSPMRVSVGTPLPPAIVRVLDGVADLQLEDDATWRDSVSTFPAGRIRLLGRRNHDLDVADGRPEIAVYAQPVVEAGRIELLTFLREQSVTVTAHRFGSPSPLADGLF